MDVEINASPSRLAPQVRECGGRGVASVRWTPQRSREARERRRVLAELAELLRVNPFLA